MNRPLAILLFAASVAPALGGKCTGGGGQPPTLTVTLNAIDDDLNDILVVPTDAMLPVNVGFSAGAQAFDPQSFFVEAYPWDGGNPVPGAVVWSDVDGGLATFAPASLEKGTYSVLAIVYDVTGKPGSALLDFAVRERPSPAPIGTGQNIWYDFTSDRDGVPGPDFPVDLEAFGLGSALDPTLSAQVEADVIEALLTRVSIAYHDPDPNGFGAPDPVDVGFFSADPAAGDVTRICIGGEDPSGGNTIGSILLDPDNSNRTSVECGSIPPTGIFPREMLVYQNQAPFQDSFDPLMPSRGGTPVGEDPLDPIVLAPGFDPGTAPPEQQARYTDITIAIERFADALGSIVAHETGHALGLVPPGPPGVGLWGGQIGPEFIHDVTSDGVSSPAPNYLMKQGGSFNFAKLAGLSGHPLPFRGLRLRVPGHRLRLHHPGALRDLPGRAREPRRADGPLARLRHRPVAPGPRGFASGPGLPIG
jgi:hypothetical protein